MNSPIIKWTGSKRSLAKEIIEVFPKDINTYFEPFLGSGAVFLRLLESINTVKSFYCSDINNDLIEIFKIIKSNPYELINSYRTNWNILQNNKNYYYEQREIYNKTKDPLIFYFLTRTSYNGLIRYNKNGEFNSAFHFSRPGMHPDKIESVLLYYNNLMSNKDITFNCVSYGTIVPTNYNDVVFADPPYTQSKNLYYGNIDFNNILNWLDNLNCNWFLTMNGISKVDNEENIYINYTGKKVLNSSKSAFRKLLKNDVVVKEYFYYKLK